MLQTFSVQGYKSLADLTLELGRFNVFVGPNGAGKTNVLEAVGLASCAAGGKVEEKTLGERGVRPGLPAIYKSSFKNDKLRRVISVNCQAPGFEYRATLDNPIRDSNRAWRYSNEALFDGDRQLASRGPSGVTFLGADGKRERQDDFNANTSIVPMAQSRFGSAPVSAWVGALARFGIFTPFTPMLRGTAPDPTQQADKPLGLLGGRLPEAIQETLKARGDTSALRHALPLIGWASGFEVGTAAEARLAPSVPHPQAVLRFQDRYMKKNRATLSGFDASEGALYVLFLLTLIGHPDAPPIAAVDNVDQALNPRLARELVRTAQDYVLAHDDAPQLLLTAHNAQVLDGLNLRDDRVRLFVVDRDTSGATQVRRITVDEAMQHKMKTHNMSLSRLWTEGFLGGMPNL